MVKKVRHPRKGPARTGPASAAKEKARKINPVVVDIYHGDTVRSFAAAREAGICGVIHKATEGRTVNDRYYTRRRAQATGADLLWGAYHFMRPGDPIAQADHFIDRAKPDKRTLVAIDHEDGRVPLANAIKCMRRVEERIGRKVILYSGWLIKKQIGEATKEEKSYLAGRRLWLSHFNSRPRWPSTWRAPWLWQFTDGKKGPRPHAIAGIPGARRELDVDSYDGTASRLAAEWAGEKLAPVTA